MRSKITPAINMPVSATRASTAGAAASSEHWALIRNALLLGVIYLIAWGLRAIYLGRSFDIFYDELIYLHISENVAHGLGVKYYTSPFYLHPPLFFLIEGAYLRLAAPIPALRILALNWRCLRHPQSGGSEINLFEQARVWVREGHSVTVFCADPGRQYAPSTHEDTDGIQVIRRGGRLTVYFFAALFLLRHGREYDCILDIANGVPFFAPLFCTKPVTLLVHHVHGRQWFEEFPYPVATLGWAIEQHIVPLVYRGRPVIAVSPTTREGLVELGIAESQLHIIYNGVSHPNATPPAVQLRRHSIAYVGRIKHYKRLDRLVRAAAALRYRFPDIQLDIAGDGDARADIEALITELGLAEYVTLHGPVDEQQKANILSSAAVFATASMHEGWGISVVEANAYGCPAVAFDVPGLRVAIRNGITGLLAEHDADFEPALAAIMQDETLRDRLSRAARRWASTFDWALSAQATLELLYTGGISSATQLPFNQWLDMPPVKPKAQELQYETKPLHEQEVGR